MTFTEMYLVSLKWAAAISLASLTLAAVVFTIIAAIGLIAGRRKDEDE